MGDVSAEPSMEDILSSIKRIIAEEGDAPGMPVAGQRARRQAARPLPIATEDDVLELDQRIDAPRVAAPAPDARAPLDAADDEPEPRVTPAAPPSSREIDHADTPAAEHIAASVSPATVQATRGALDSLTRLVVKPEPGSDGTLEGMVRDMLRPMLSAWLDQHLPRLVEEMVAREIAKITASADR